MNKNNEDIPVKEIGELLDMVSSKVPGLVKELMASLYSKDAGKQMGGAAGSFFNELVASGIPKEDALEMTKDYLNTIKNLMPDHIKNDN